MEITIILWTVFNGSSNSNTISRNTIFWISVFQEYYTGNASHHIGKPLQIRDSAIIKNQTTPNSGRHDLLKGYLRVTSLLSTVSIICPPFCNLKILPKAFVSFSSPIIAVSFCSRFWHSLVCWLNSFCRERSESKLLQNVNRCLKYSTSAWISHVLYHQVLI